MTPNLSKRLAEIVDALPVKKGSRILEIGCGTGVAAREIAGRLGNGHILAIDRSSKAIEQAIKGSATEISKGSLTFRKTTIEEFELEAGEVPFDFAFAIRVGALDGRHPEIEQQALAKIAKALKPGGKLFIDGGDPLKEVKLRNVQ
ncbi:class I SAM-dependent methyltransferase [Flavihumibacter solisilvae]|uniref:Methyltransferase type 12 n=1 Tax=Flavihumibacter solisilvae TaxID=1349421 RepID=A0A0C1L423_9BACT|nr:class I SAM-dependent methyltransferase [Flavihumibacter solisilvae]KIC94361.1 methyltransferase type 12 [Flavihumibacter solisilvae]